VKAPGGKRDFIGKVWPGKSRFPDFLSAPVRHWWAQEQAAFQRLGLAGIWNDMNEPALFDTPGKTLPDDCVHPSILSHLVLRIDYRGANRFHRSWHLDTKSP
jgi:alpha-glucosidase (family GH31 glycosyl hydrolase)